MKGAKLRLEQISLWDKHLQSEGEIPNMSLISFPDREERKGLLDKMVRYIQKKHPKSSIFFADAEEVPWKQIWDQMSTLSLFKDPEVIIWDGVKQLTETQEEALIRLFGSSTKDLFLVFGSESAKSFSSLFQKASSGVMFLDLTGEKSWEKQKRLEQELYRWAQSEGKTLAPEAAYSLLALCGGDAVALESEWKKCLCFVAERSSILQRDVLAVGSASLHATGWQIAESWIWGGDLKASLPLIDLSFLLAFMGQLRYQLMQVNQMEVYCQRGAKMEEYAKALSLIHI